MHTPSPLLTRPPPPRARSTIFLADIAITFFVPYKSSIKQGGFVIFDRRRIAGHYMRGWLTFDVLTAIPFDLLVSVIAVAQGWGADASAQLIQLLRVVRLAKLLRIVRLARILRRWQDHVSISFALLSLAKFIFLTVLLAHWLACGWGFIAIASDAPWTGYDDGLSWKQKAQVRTTNEYELCTCAGGIEPVSEGRSPAPPHACASAPLR